MDRLKELLEKLDRLNELAEKQDELNQSIIFKLENARVIGLNKISEKLKSELCRLEIKYKEQRELDKADNKQIINEIKLEIELEKSKQIENITYAYENDDIQYMSCVIYCLTFPDNKVYIGQTHNRLMDRILDHHIEYVEKCHDSNLTKKLKAILKYKTFKISILEKVPFRSHLNMFEIYWIDEYDSYKNGYNSTKGGDAEYSKYDMKSDLILRTKLKQLNLSLFDKP